jgi:hypothetical protein
MASENERNPYRRVVTGHDWREIGSDGSGFDLDALRANRTELKPPDEQ